MKKRVLIHIMVLLLLVAAEVVLINAASKAQNQPLSVDVVEVISTMVLCFTIFMGRYHCYCAGGGFTVSASLADTANSLLLLLKPVSLSAARKRVDGCFYGSGLRAAGGGKRIHDRYS